MAAPHALIQDALRQGPLTQGTLMQRALTQGPLAQGALMQGALTQEGSFCAPETLWWERTLLRSTVPDCALCLCQFLTFRDTLILTQILIPRVS